MHVVHKVSIFRNDKRNDACLAEFPSFSVVEPTFNPKELA